MKPQNLMTLVIFLLILAIGGVGYFLYGKNAIPPTVETPTEQVAEEATTDVTEETAAVRTIDDMMTARSIGAADAPVTVIEYSSLSCSHCADFHKDTLPAVKEKFIDTGKVKLIFKEFPLNIAAIEASMLLRCLPEDKYMPFQDTLFANQEAWAHVENYRDILIQYAQLAGFTPEESQACIDNKELAERITKDMQDAGKSWKVSATPTFIFNNGVKTENGAISIETFSAAVDEVIAAGGATATAPATETLQPADATEPTPTTEAVPVETPTTEEPAKTE